MQSFLHSLKNENETPHFSHGLESSYEKSLILMSVQLNVHVM